MVLSVCLIYSTVTKGIEAERSFGQSAPHGPLYGIYNTNYFIKNKDTIPFSFADSIRWKQLVIDGGGWNQSGLIQFCNDKKSRFEVITDTTKRILKMQSADSSEKYSFAYFIPDINHMLIKGLWKKDSIQVLLIKYDLDNFVLHKEKFKWISN
jgi:hypothetical protein